MPLFRASGQRWAKAEPRQGRKRKTGSRGRTDEEGSALSLTQLCLLSLADNMREVWAKDYADNYMDQYCFRHIMGPFNLLPAELVEELTWLLCSRKQMSRAALHLLLVPQLRGLSLEKCPGLVTASLCAHVAARCQALCSLDLSGAQQLPSRALSETLGSLPVLRSLSLAGTPCDRCVIWSIAHRCPLLRHLDVSSCHLLCPAALLPLGGGAYRSSTGSTSPFRRSSTSKSSLSTSSSDPVSPPTLRSLLALDIGFGEQEGDAVAAAAYLLLSLPYLERVALEGLSEAFCLVHHREFGQTDEFTRREGVPTLEELWKEGRHMDSRREKGEEEEDSILLEGYESEEDVGREESCSLRVASCSDNGSLILRLRDIKGLSCDSLDSLGHLCPDICSISVNLDDFENSERSSQGSLLAAGLQTWSGQLRSLSVHYPGPLEDLLPALQVAGSSLVSLALEGVKTNSHTPLLELIQACPKLKDLLISAEPPTVPQEEGEGEDEDERDLPRLPNLCSLTLNFSYEHNQMRPAMSWMSLKRAIRCLLTGSPLLEKLSLVALPCPLNGILQDVLCFVGLDRSLSAASSNSFLMPLGRVQHLDLPRTDVTMITVKRFMERSRRLKHVDLSYCWQISQLECSSCERFSKVQLVWV